MSQKVGGVGQSGSTARKRVSTPSAFEEVADELAVRVVADARDDRDLDAEAREPGRDVAGVAARRSA